MQNTQHLLETVALNILDGFETAFPEATGMYIRIDKLGPQLGGKVGLSFVEFSK
jgi:dihydroneopterin aldolase